jgi:hypothetical protein
MSIPIPDLFPITPPFTDMDRARIFVMRDSGNTVGSIVCFERPVDKLFGVRIDIVYPPVMDSNARPASTENWDKFGEIPIEYLSLSMDAIKAIQRQNSEDFEFTIDLRTRS